MRQMYRTIIKYTAIAALAVGVYYAGRMAVRYDVFGTESRQIQKIEQKAPQYQRRDHNLERRVNTIKFT